MKALVLQLHRKAEAWPKGRRQGDGWFQWHLCPVDLPHSDSNANSSGVRIEEVIKDICDVTGVEVSRLKRGIRGPGGNPERRFAVWARQNSTYLMYREIGASNWK
jgi:hypothetical protein